MQTYSGWAEADKTDYKKWIQDVFAKKNLDFLTNHGGQCDDHYWVNWDLVMKMGEYTALFNLGGGTDQKNATSAWLITKYQIPFNQYEYCVDCSCANKTHGATHTAVADDTAGCGNLHTGWEIYYNHYAKVKNLGSGYKYARQAADKARPEAGVDGSSRYGTNSGAFDQLGWGTLMMYRE